MKKEIRLSLGQFCTWKTDYKIIAAFLIELCFVFGLAQRYDAYCAAINVPTAFLEAYIIMGSDKRLFSCILLIVLFSLSDIPFINERSSYELIRTGVKSFLQSRVLYIVITLTIINVIPIAILFVLNVCGKSAGSLKEWSRAIILLAERQPDFAVSNFKLLFSHPGFLYSTIPITAVIITFLFNFSYCFIIVFTMMIFNVNCKHVKLGWGLAVAIHITGYIISNNNHILGIYFSLLDCATPACQFDEGAFITPLFSAWVFAITILLLFHLLGKVSERFQL